MTANRPTYRFNLLQRVLVVNAEAFGRVVARKVVDGAAVYSVQYEHGSRPVYTWAEHELEATR